jgi:hypothetical protein
MNELLTSVPDAVCPHNLADTLGAWFKRLGFKVARDDNDRLTHLQATWTDTRGQLFTATYLHYHAADEPHTGLFSLFVRLDGAKSSSCLVSAMHVRRGREVRLMLLANNHYKAARQAALDAGALLPAHAQSAS